MESTKQNSTNPQDLDTLTSYSPNQNDETPQTATPPVHVEVEFGALSNAGKVRKNNEDSYIVLKLSREMTPLYTNVPEKDLPLPFEETGYGMVVADGMGGQRAGEVASRSAIQVLMNLTTKAPKWTLKLHENEARELMARAINYYRKIDSELSERAKSDPGLTGMGTTMTGTYSIGSDLFTIHVGDSRAYLFRGGKLYQLTRDQTIAQALADTGQIPQYDVSKHPLRHMLTNAMGYRDGEIVAEIQHLQLGHDDRLLLCSDGLNEMVTDEVIADTLSKIEGSANACQALVELALNNGGKDNVTVLIAKYSITAA